MPNSPEPDSELAVTAGPVNLKTKNVPLTQTALFVLACGIVYVGFTVQAHSGDSEKSAKVIAETLEKSNANVAKTVKESNDNLVRVLEQVAREQQKGNEHQMMTNCLLALPQDRRTNAGETCRRIIRGDR